MKDKSMEYVFMVVAALLIIRKLMQPERDTWDYALILVGTGLISLSLYRLFFKK